MAALLNCQGGSMTSKGVHMSGQRMKIAAVLCVTGVFDHFRRFSTVTQGEAALRAGTM